MTALTQGRIAKRLADQAFIPLLSMPVKAGAKLFTGALVCTDATGYAVPGSAVTGLKCWGICEGDVDNTTGTSGAQWVRVRRGAFNLNVGTSGDALAISDIGAMVFVIDDNTVGKIATARSVAGKFLGFETDGTPYFEITGQIAA